MSTTPDPRPAVTIASGTACLQGWRCRDCRHPMLWASPRCPICGGTVGVDQFGPEGTVWSSTVVRVPVPGRTPPYAMAYVDLDDGPRVLAHVAGPPERLAVGARVMLHATVKHAEEHGEENGNEHGDVMVGEVR